MPFIDINDPKSNAKKPNGSKNPTVTILSKPVSETKPEKTPPDISAFISQVQPTSDSSTEAAGVVKTNKIDFNYSPENNDEIKKLEDIKLTEDVTVKVSDTGVKEILADDKSSASVPPQSEELKAVNNVSQPQAKTVVDLQKNEIVDDNQVDILTPVAAPSLDLNALPPLPKQTQVVSNEVKVDVPIEELKPPISNLSTAGLQAVTDMYQNTGNARLSEKFYSLDELIQSAVIQNASDLHLNVGYRAMVRVDGDLKTIASQELTPEHVEEYAKQIIKGRGEFDLAKIKQIDLTYSHKSVRLRVNIYRQQGKLAVAMRVIPDVIKTVEELNLPPVVKEFSGLPNGLVLVTGPTGSGKSTTLAAMINLINLTKPKHIITLEDPIEYVYPKGLGLIDQREFGVDFDSWDDSLRSALRQDPDIVLVGEMRDLSTIQSALQIAETGHLVFATLHTNSASETINRIIDVFPSETQEQIRTLLASVIRAVVSQRLVPINGGGRRPAVEIMIANSAIKNCIRDRKVFQVDNIIQTAQEEGMISMPGSLVRMVKDGLITTEQAKENTVRPAEVEILLRKS